MEKKKEKTIYDLGIHESILVKIDNNAGYPYIWQVTRVPSGWIYQNSNSNLRHPEGYFVPFDNRFME